MIPASVDGLLPPGIHAAEWNEIETYFGTNPRRRWLLDGLRDALLELRRVKCAAAFLDGSFVTDKPLPGDYDLCWDHTSVDLGEIDPVFLDAAPPRATQRAKYRGDLLPNVVEANSGRLFVDFFQIDKATGKAKGIIAIDPGSIA